VATRRTAEPEIASASLLVVAELVDPVLARFLAERRAELAGLDPTAVVLVAELERLVAAGGKRIRPALCAWAHVAAGGALGEPIANACVGLELLHTCAIVHDDVMDGATERRGVPTTHVRFGAEAPPGRDPQAFGAASAILVGDLALVLSEQAFRASGFGGTELERAMRRFDRMRTEMAVGQFLDVGGRADPARVAALKTGSYTAVGPVTIGCALAGAPQAVEAPLGVYARLVGEAFQLRDDVLDGEADAGVATRIDDLIDGAVQALDGAPVAPEGAEALAELAQLLRLPAEA
jgi:geranylgeranyl diphosphate synthase type I